MRQIFQFKQRADVEFRPKRHITIKRAPLLAHAPAVSRARSNQLVGRGVHLTLHFRESEIMGLCLRTAAASAIAFTIGAMSTADAQVSQPYHHRHEIAHRPPASQGGDVIVPTGRSYLDPGTSAAVGTEDRYFY